MGTGTSKRQKCHESSIKVLSLICYLKPLQLWSSTDVWIMNDSVELRLFMNQLIVKLVWMIQSPFIVSGFKIATRTIIYYKEVIILKLSLKLCCHFLVTSYIPHIWAVKISPFLFSTIKDLTNLQTFKNVRSHKQYTRNVK